ncbi:probable methyltransferase PMT17 [Dendrobium catenatum]|nr:probable methyltransferase PMT17 [Dendrobium catenatum]XP_028550186.1 probable methyltransferase PMT17 [Dendrobium catenatum]XP_028550187.1 probable methyltransferase PMT17 [Dendrobium catenatum]XP_028550188.1 probable methyltransferase PMT17 [Dendrobium catenatum]XP_028550189.1 probable methyltransferase PMT17 [Dendrobium catenatum]
MAKDYPGPANFYQLESRRQRLTWILAISSLCAIFYVIGAWQNSSIPKSNHSNISKVRCDDISDSTALSKNSLHGATSLQSNANLDFNAHHQLDLKNTSPSMENFQPCAMNFSEYTPCEDRTRGRRFERAMLVYRERHCPTKDELIRCLIPAPPGYKKPFKWPQSRDYAWYHNIPHKKLSVEKAVQNWIQVEGDRFLFPGGGTMFPEGADAYIDDINELIPLTDGSIRTAIDTGCGVASWGAYLLKKSVLTMSFAPRDTHEAQVQFALERGVPAMIGVMASMRIPYPARSFDMAHCSRCLIPWQAHEGLYLLEVDRVLRPGGFWILSGPPIHWKKYYRGWERTQEDLKQEQDAIEEVATHICWKKVIEKEDLSIWQKPINHNECINSRKVYQTPHICKNGNADAAWYKKMETCITPLPETSKDVDVAGGELRKWPERAFAVPPRISMGTIPGITAEKFEEDNKMWKERVAYYKKLAPTLSRGRYRNVMDMNANIGGFAAAIDKYQVWVMNVVPVNSDQDTLGVIYERGFIGTYQDWCEAFSTYPRTYDFIHADGVFSTYQERCDITYILLEMDRILRPEGTVLFRDTVEVLVKIQTLIRGMRWDSKMMDHESGPFNPEKILIAVKSYWTGQATK